MSAAQRGTVYLVGAGPGDFGLVTQRAIELVRSADVLLVDQLVPRELIEVARLDAVIVNVGSSGSTPAMDQHTINTRLVDEARSGRSVVRLKGGDPYLFARGGEEALHCRAAHVTFEVVPGVASALAACTSAGIPVTHRDISPHVTIVAEQADPDYDWLARSGGTIVLLVQLHAIDQVVDKLLAAGVPAQMPCAVISRATTSAQRVVPGTLHTILRLVTSAQLEPPVLLVVGIVVDLREHLAWFERRALFGTRVAVTRPTAQADGLVQRLTTLGAAVTRVPTIAIEPLDPAALDVALDALPDTQTVVFTSCNGVDVTFARLAARGLDARVFGAVRTIAAVGEATAAALATHGLRVDVVPDPGARTAVGLLEHLLALPLFGTRCVIFRAEQGDDRLPEGLRGVDVDVLVAAIYRTVPEQVRPEQVEALVSSDVVLFSSASTITSCVALVDGDASLLPPCITIGASTTQAASAAGLTVLQQADDPSVTALVAATVARALDNQGVTPWRHAAANAPRRTLR